jgi:hypothetical protein
MLESVSAQISECLRQAEECARRATGYDDPKLRQGYLDGERRWLKLAQSLEFSERLDRFTSNAHPTLVGWHCPGCQKSGWATVSRGPPFTVQWLPPPFRVMKESTTREGTKIGCKCGELFDL